MPSRYRPETGATISPAHRTANPSSSRRGSGDPSFQSKSIASSIRVRIGVPSTRPLKYSARRPGRLAPSTLVNRALAGTGLTSGTPVAMGPPRA